MIDQISVEKFKSYAKEAYLPLTTLTVLIGANASGKSNLIEGIRFLKWLAMGKRLDEISRMQSSHPAFRGQTTDLFFDTDYPFRLGVSLDGKEPNKPYLEVKIGLLHDRLVIVEESAWTPDDSTKMALYWVESQTSPHTDEIRVSYNNFSQGGNKPYISCSNQQAVFYQLQSPARFAEKHERSQVEIPNIATKLREQLQNIAFLDTRPSQMRGYSWKNDAELKEDGSNVSSVLFKICSQGDEAKAELLNFIRSLPEQDILDIDFIETPRQEVMVRLIEPFRRGIGAVDAPLLSDGTLRVLAVAALLLSAAENALVVIEEIDNGVHPSRAKSLIENIRLVAQRRNLRVLLTTHNPALLDAIPDDNLEDVICCYRDRDEGDSRVARLGDLPRYPELAAQATLGELVTNRVLDHFINDKTTKEERKQQSLQWLSEFKQQVAE
jgi:predicted ATPase